MPKKRYRPEEIFTKQQVKSVCAGFAVRCHFLSEFVTSCPLDGGPNRLKTLRRQAEISLPLRGGQSMSDETAGSADFSYHRE